MSALTLGDVAFLGAATGVGELYPVGGIVMWGSASLPEGWVVCDGSNGTPDLRGLFVVSSGSTYAVGDTGGVESVTLTSSEMAAHTHSRSGYLLNTTGLHVHSYTETVRENISVGNTGFTPVSTNWTTEVSGNHSHSISGTTGTAGTSGSHENRPAYYALIYMMRIA